MTFQNVFPHLAQLGLGQTWSWPNLVWPNLVTKLGQTWIWPKLVSPVPNTFIPRRCVGNSSDPSPHNGRWIGQHCRNLEGFTFVGHLARRFPNLCLTLVDPDACLAPQRSRQHPVDCSDSVWMTDGVNVVQVSRQHLTFSDVGLDVHQSPVLAQTEEKGHHRVALFTSLRLHDGMNGSRRILP